jgi:hypothetical protein
MMRDLTGQVVIVTGASSGIGARTAELLARRGAIPVLTARSESKLREAVGRIPGEHAAHPLDVTDYEAVQRVVRLVYDRYGRIDVLVACAGFGEFLPFAEAPVDHFRAMMEVNYMGTVHCAQAVLPYMLRAGSGHLVHVASLAGKVATVKAAGYAASKHAVLGLTDALRQELKPAGIAVSAVNPGPVDTPFFDRADPTGAYVDRVRRFMMTPDRVAQAIVRVIERRTPELDLPRTAAIGAKLYRLFPRLSERLFSGIFNRK